MKHLLLLVAEDVCAQCSAFVCTDGQKKLKTKYKKRKNMIKCLLRYALTAAPLTDGEREKKMKNE